ncbi:uncharacterized protein LOC124927612 [Impatiens glandulifera]|uniref:uncharacterized protein LOC124927612 n=1 Tax=Impatiens glandulifera TaxID=253017 RepID=UPI001FB13316|nr:uncharacterized protein LOC124927612 [Impatiens glandulifera]
MYKSEVHRLCLRNQWDQPVYSTVKEGPDHGSRYNATVTVNGTTFHSAEQSSSTKEAHNKAAKAAYDHLSAPQIINPNPPPPTQQSGEVVPNLAHLSSDGQHVHKTLLRDYANRKRLANPLYSSERIPGGSKRFKSKVTVGGQTYENQNYYLTEKEAEIAVATVACEKLMKAEEIQKAKNAMYKSLLLELTRKSGVLPKFVTKIHMKLYTSSVEIGDKTFEGQPAPTKKLAESSAAKVAYTAMQQVKNTGDLADQNTTKGSSPGPILDKQQLTKADQNTTKGSSLGPILDKQQLTKSIPSSSNSADQNTTKGSSPGPILNKQQLTKSIPSSSNSVDLPDKKTDVVSPQLTTGVERGQMRKSVQELSDENWNSMLKRTGINIQEALDESLFVLKCALAGNFHLIDGSSAVAEEKDVAMDVDGSNGNISAVSGELVSINYKAAVAEEKDVTMNLDGSKEKDVAMNLDGSKGNISSMAGEVVANYKSAVAEEKDVAMDIVGSKDKEATLECETNLKGQDLSQLSMELGGCSMKKRDLLETPDLDSVAQVKRAKLSHPENVEVGDQLESSSKDDAGKSNSSISSTLALNKPIVDPFIVLKSKASGETISLSYDNIAIYPRVPNLEFPDDGSITVLPFHNDMWVMAGVNEKK